MISIPFFSLLLSSVSPTVLTVFVELPSTNPSDETADLPWLLNFDAIRNLKRDFDFVCTTTCKWTKQKCETLNEYYGLPLHLPLSLLCWHCFQLSLKITILYIVNFISFQMNATTNIYQGV